MLDGIAQYMISIMASADLKNFDTYGILYTEAAKQAKIMAQHTDFGRILLAISTCFQATGLLNSIASKSRDQSISEGKSQSETDFYLEKHCDKLQEQCKRLENKILDHSKASGMVEILLPYQALLRQHIACIKFVADYCKIYYSLAYMKELADHNGGQLLYIKLYKWTIAFTSSVMKANERLKTLLLQCQQQTQMVANAIQPNSATEAISWERDSYYPAEMQIKQLNDQIEQCSVELKKLHLSKKAAKAKYGTKNTDKILAGFTRFLPNIIREYLGEEALKSLSSDETFSSSERSGSAPYAVGVLQRSRG